MKTKKMSNTDLTKNWGEQKISNTDLTKNWGEQKMRNTDLTKNWGEQKMRNTDLTKNWAEPKYSWRVSRSLSLIRHASCDCYSQDVYDTSRNSHICRSMRRDFTPPLLKKTQKTHLSPEIASLSRKSHNLKT